MEYYAGHYLIRYLDSKCERRNDEGNSKVAVLVENRCSFWLPLVLKNFCDKLDESWNFHLFLTRPVAEFIRAELPEFKPRISIFEHSRRFTASEYTKLLLDRDFWNAINEETILLFQLDSIILRSPDEEFLEYDIIGAPCGNFDSRSTIFNGGFSIRKKKAMLHCINFVGNKLRDGRAEDVAFTQEMREMRCFKIPSIRTAIQFSAESIYDSERPPVGVHGTNQYYMSSEMMGKLLS